MKIIYRSQFAQSRLLTMRNRFDLNGFVALRELCIEKEQQSSSGQLRSLLVALCDHATV